MAKPLVRIVKPLLASPRDMCEANGDVIWRRFLEWRRSALVLVLVFTVLTVGSDALGKLTAGPQPAFTIALQWVPESGPVEQTLFGDIADAVWMLAFYAMPASALLAVLLWERPRASRSILLVGWIGSFVAPVAIALTPWSWWTIERPPATIEAELARQQQRITAGFYWGYYYIVVLSPAVLALVPGLMRACIRIKMLLPEATLAGWFLVVAAPFNGLLVLVTFVAAAQVAPSPLLLAGMLLWLAAPLVYLARAADLTRPLASAVELRSIVRVRALAWILALGSAVCLIVYVATWEAYGLRLVGFEAKASLLRPWSVVRYFLEFSGRALFVTVLGADLLLQATLAAWRRQRAFLTTPTANEFDRLMGTLQEASM